MSIEVTARHSSATVETQQYARGKADELMREFPRIEHVHVILNIERHLNIAEAVVQAKNHVRVEATGSSDNMQVSIDTAFSKAEKQLRKIKEKVVDHKTAPRENAV